MRIVSPPDRTERVSALLCEDVAVTNVAVYPGAARHPAGDVVTADVAREDASVLLSDLRDLGIDRDGAISLELVDTAISPGARRAVEEARGDEADAVVWEQVEQRTSESAALSGSYLAFMVIATLLAAVGIFTNNPILIVGAMVVGPEFGPLAGLCVATVNGRSELARRSGVALVVGFAAGILAAFVLSLFLRAVGLDPETFDTDHGLVKGIASPDAYTVIVAACAGVAGMISLTTAKAGALIGVLISVTTIPSAADVAVSLADSDPGNAVGAAGQLGLNLATMIVVGLLTLVVQRRSYARRRRRHRAQRLASSAQ
jgi:uncharacterized hydrophobic protein (TIGR00271 family)